LFVSQEMIANVENLQNITAQYCWMDQEKKSTFKEKVVYTSNLHHNEAERAFTLETVTSEYLYCIDSEFPDVNKD